MGEVEFLPKNIFSDSKFFLAYFTCRSSDSHSAQDDGEAVPDDSAFSYPHCLFSSLEEHEMCVQQ